MKTERRHELQTNTLANSLGEGIEKVRPYVNHILLALGAVIVLLIAISLFRSQSRAKQASAWEAFFVATTPSETSAQSEQDLLRGVLKDFSDTRMADWAKLTIGDESLNAGAQAIAASKSDARKNINAAIAEYRPLAESSDVPQVRSLANYNLGLSYELLGEVDKAIESYRNVNGALATLAKKRVDALEGNAEVKDFYKWYADAEPAVQAITGGSQPGRMPPFSVDDPKVTPFEDAPGSKTVESDLPPVELFPKDGNKTPANPGDVKLPGLGVESPATTPVVPEATPETPTVPEAPADAPAADAPAADAPAAEAQPAAEATPAVDAAPAEESKPAEPAPAVAEPAPAEAPAP